MKLTFEKEEGVLPERAFPRPIACRSSASWIFAQAVRTSAFSRVDLLAVLFMVALLGTWLVVGRMGEYGRTARCAANLAALGKAMQNYADENAESLPAAGIDLNKTQTCWDKKILPYLKAGKAGATSERFFESAPRFFVCPSDSAPHKQTPRSYAMNGNDMWPDDWPPGPDSATGVGLWWNQQTVSTLLPDQAPQKPEALPTVKLSVIPDPANTLLLTELISSTNLLGSLGQATVFESTQELPASKDKGVPFHHGKFNYLMVDGHVESLTVLQTSGVGGIWTLKKGE